MALATAGRYAEARELFEALLKAEPDNQVTRLSLANTVRLLSQFRLARAHLQYVVEHAPDEKLRKVARGQIESLDRELGEDEPNQRLVELQIAALRRRRETGIIADEGRVRLVHRLIRRQPRHPDESLIEEATLVLEEGLVQHANAVSLLEPLVLCYLELDPENHLDEVVGRLERLAPNSPVLETLAGDRDVDARAPILRQRIDELVGTVMGDDDPAFKQAAVQDLGAIVAQYPSNAARRSIYAFTLLFVGRRDEARRQAERAAQDAGDDYLTHYNVGQVLWLTGDETGGRRHLDLAWQVATDESERRGVESFVAQVSSDG